MIDIMIPNLGNEISEAEITEWLVGIGEEVEEGDVVLLISTTKTSLEIESPLSGKISQINFNDPLIKALCDACSSLGKAEGLLKISYLNNRLVNLSGEINLQSPGFLSERGKLTAKIGLSNSIASAFFIQSSYTLKENKYVLPNILCGHLRLASSFLPLLLR